MRTAGAEAGPSGATLPLLRFIALSLSDPVTAHRYARPFLEDLFRAGLADLWDTWLLGDAVEALIALGEVDDAPQRVLELEKRSRSLRSAAGLASAARCRGLLLMMSGELSAAIDEFEGALEQLGRPEDPFSLARTLLVKGTAERRAKRKRAARESLRRALEVFEQLGLQLWAEKVRGELVRVAGKAAGSEELTPTEERVAALVVEGRSNREVASALFVTVKTVEHNLSSIYRKLGVRCRSQLTHRFVAHRTGTAATTHVGQAKGVSDER